MNIKGFTLIEQMIVVGVMALLLSTAYPSFKRHFHKARRAEAQSTLYAFAMALERYRSEHATKGYVGATASNEGKGPGSPRAYIFPSQAPQTGDDKFYELEIYSASNSAYELRAIPLAKSEQIDDRCGVFILNSKGEKRNLGINGAQINGAPCWK